MALSSCSKEDATPSLSGTEWYRIEEGVVSTIHFMNEQESIITIDDYATAYYIYSYEHPIVEFAPMQDGMASLRGTVSGLSMEVINLSNQKQVGIFIKK